MNRDEIAMDYKKELKKRISADYERRVKQWMAADPSQLIDAAEEITAARLIRDNIEDAINEEDARFLLGLDEPFKGLDEATARQCMDALARRAAGRAVLLVTHDAQEGDYLHARTLQMEELQRV